MTRAFFGNWLGAFRDGWAVTRAMPFLVAVMIGIEFAQHAIELHLGFFSLDKAVRRAASEEPLRMMFGWPKMLTVYAVAFFTTRWLVTRDVRATLRPSSQALRRYAGVVLFLVIPAAAMIHARAILPVLGFGEPEVVTFRMIFGLFSLLAEPLLLLWFVNAAMGTDAYGPAASAKTTGWLYVWAFMLLFVTRVPVSQLHARLNAWPAGQTPAVQWAMFALDALVVGVLTVIVPAIQVRIARFIADRRKVELLGDPQRRFEPLARPSHLAEA
ncbi:hypothetical protein [Sphingomonas faeni]|uniref:hypothetical protein n=1 Tax=Sphingomonas faeni TaxID=185950 RepID=UPI0027878E07|nr:hypothetical protein [Sphingomonas faeni]MDQ0839079.1 uncharacterized membrane protein (DUF485 family) [Sphingomonas faeni]